MEKALNYGDVYLVPDYSGLKSRSEADVSREFLGRRWRSPVCLSNMESVISETLAKWLSENDYFYVMHRFGNTKAFIEKANKENWKTISISIGVKHEDFELIEWWHHNSNCRIDFITIDIAHGHSVHMMETLKHIKSHCDGKKNPKIIAGNVATPNAVLDMGIWGADAAKVGIGGGGICSTKNMTGFHVPMFSCVLNCVMQGGPNQVEAAIPIIADGGIRENGDITKALFAGATMVMAGGIFAACIDAPGEDVYLHCNVNAKPTYKVYWGSASAKQKGENKHVEGFEKRIECNDLTVAQKYVEIEQSLQSACSYAGGKDFTALGGINWVQI